MNKSRTGIVTFLFTGVDYSAPWFQSLSDEGASAVWRAHSEIVRECRGQTRTAGLSPEVKNLGDGFMLVFPSVLDALACSVAIQRATSRYNQEQEGRNLLQVRIGLHAGEPMRDKDAYLGRSLLVAKRLCECARGGQTLVSAVVRKLVGSRGAYAFRDLQPLTLKGMAEPLPVFEVVCLEAECHSLWAEAQFASERDDEESCIASLRKALAIGKEHGYTDAFIGKPAVMAGLCVKALEAEIEVEYLHDLIRKRNLVPGPPPIHLENWPWPLRIHTLGRFELVLDGKRARFSRKAQQKPLAMLKALIAFGGEGREITEDHVADALWPDAEGDMAHQAFATTLHRLRKLLGQKEVIHFGEGRLAVDRSSVWVDAWAFEGLLAWSETTWKNMPKKDCAGKAIEMTQKAIALYRGTFLPGEVNEPWSLSARERLRSKFLRSVLTLGNYWETVREWDRAAEWYQQGLDVDDLAEEFYRRLMVSYQELGRTTDALRVYDRCKRTLSGSLGIEPFAETEAIRKSLLSKKNP
jgi:class 3 adenylate cyclase/DNA-binding SARP family transcriptional activator